MIATKKQEVAQSLANALQQLHQREQLLEARERIFELKTASISPNDNQRVEISVRELQLWMRQAKAIGRSPEHLRSIALVLQTAEKKKRESGKISERAFQTRCRDLDEFNRQAFQLME